VKRYYIGLATTFHDSALSIIGMDGEILFAEATERFLQYKRAYNCEADNFVRVPKLLKEYCDPDAEYVFATTWSGDLAGVLDGLSEGGTFTLEKVRDSSDEVNRSLVREYSELVFLAYLHAAQRTAGHGLVHGLREAFGHSRFVIKRYPHHLTHAAYSCLTSPFKEAACMVVDGIGEFGSMAFYQYSDGGIQTIKRHRGPESLGFLYGLVTELCGFDLKKGEEWKVMGLAPYGRFDREAYDLLRRLYHFESGKLKFASLREIRKSVNELREIAQPWHLSPEKAADLACVGQAVFCEIMLALLRDFGEKTDSVNLALGGGCALNSSFNGEILSQTEFENLYVPSAPADDGASIGAALLAFREDHPEYRPDGKFLTPYLGTRISTNPILRMIEFGAGGKVEQLPETICERAASLISEGKLVGWVQGRAEFGPRALGNRSILADPRPADMKDRINARVKLREPFRPFAPSILHEFGEEYFENYQEAPYMERTLRFRKEVMSRIPSVVHFNGTGRLQTVKAEWNPKYYKLIKCFHDITGIPLVLNTSFNIMGKPIIHSAEDAIALFYTSGLDALVIEDYLITK
jgi:carbamoyltransferase